jgi:hypothetical protein
MKTAILALLGSVSSHLFQPTTGVLTPEDYEFFRFIAQYGKSYGTKAEFEFRSA